MTNKSIKACRQRQNQAEKLNPSLFKTNSFSVRESRLASQCIFDLKDLVTCAIQRAIFKNLERIPVQSQSAVARVGLCKAALLCMWPCDSDAKYKKADLEASV